MPAETLPVLSYRPPRRDAVTIIADPGGRGVSITIEHRHERPRPLVIGFASLAVVATAPLLIAVILGGNFDLRSGLLVAFAGLCTLLALAAAVRSQSEPLEFRADADGLHMAGGVVGETRHWTRDEIVHVLADDPRDRPPGAEPFVISIEFHDDLLVLAVPSAEDQAAVAAALRGALNRPVPTSERLR